MFSNRKEFKKIFRENCPDNFPVEIYLEAYFDDRKFIYDPDDLVYILYFKKFRKWIEMNRGGLEIPKRDSTEFYARGSNGIIISDKDFVLKYFYVTTEDTERINFNTKISIYSDELMGVFYETMNYFILKTIINTINPGYWNNHFVKFDSIFVTAIENGTLQCGIKMERLQDLESCDATDIVSSLLDFQKDGCTIIHGDTKFQNIMNRSVVVDGKVSILPVFIDFGIVSTQISFVEELDNVKISYTGTIFNKDLTTKDLVGIDLYLYKEYLKLQELDTPEPEFYDRVYNYVINKNLGGRQ